MYAFFINVLVLYAYCIYICFRKEKAERFSPPRLTSGRGFFNPTSRHFLYTIHQYTYKSKEGNIWK